MLQERIYINHFICDRFQDGIEQLKGEILEPRILEYYRQLPYIETGLLAKGLNFSITSKTLPNKDITATIEDAVKDPKKDKVDTIHGCGFESRCSQLNFRCRACFEQGVP